MRKIALLFAINVVLLAATAGCSPQSNEDPATAAGQNTAELADTAWRLVKIQSMDDTESVPADPSRYTLSFGPDGGVVILADCNRGTTSFSSEAQGELTFGVIAATQAICPPGSLHDIYMKQFEWVRSYVLEDGHLFLATMADGSIVEFEPLTAATADE